MRKIVNKEIRSAERNEYAEAVPLTAIKGEVHIPSDEDFASWTRNPVTIFVAAYHKMMADQIADDWVNYSWNSSKAIEPEKLYQVLQELRIREETYRSFLTNKKEIYESKLKK